MTIITAMSQRLGREKPARPTKVRPSKEWRHQHGKARREMLARDSWRLLMKVAESHMEEAGARLTSMGLSPVTGHFLDEIARIPPGPISQLGARMNVDPGWVTDVI